MKSKTPNAEQLNSLHKWSRTHGRTWKASLRHAWMTGDYHGFEESNLLQQVRNEFGPSWLTSFKVKQ